MYKIIGSDGKEYGPVSAEVIRQWIGERRVDGGTRLQNMDIPGWKPVSEFPEFAASLSVPPPILAPPLLATPSPTPNPKTSRLAIASLILGLLGLCGVTAIVGLILGIKAQIKIRKSGGQLKGSGLAIAGICLSAAMLVLFMAALLIPAFAKGRDKSTLVDCQNNMKQITLAIRLYAEENQGQCPPAATWSDAIASGLPAPSVLRCPKLAGEECAYGFNSAASGKPLSSLPSDTVLLFEASGGCNFFGGPDALAASPFHRNQYLIGFADGSVRQVLEQDVSGLRWNP